MVAEPETYAARLEIDYPEEDLDRVSSFFRILWAIPIIVILALLGGAGGAAGGGAGETTGPERRRERAHGPGAGA